MSKWCGDENCLQCADKEPDLYVHLPRADYDALREQNRVLAEAVRTVKRAKALQFHVLRDTDTNEFLEGYEAACVDILAALAKGRA